MAKFPQHETSMAVGVGREEFEGRAKMKHRAIEDTVGEFVIGDRGAEQPEVEIPVGLVALEEVHGVLEFLMSLEELGTVEQLDAAPEVLITGGH